MSRARNSQERRARDEPAEAHHQHADSLARNSPVVSPTAMVPRPVGIFEIFEDDASIGVLCRPGLSEAAAVRLSQKNLKIAQR
jgi:hypothetical protein